MEYPLPQFLSIKPKIAGPFNLRELLYIVGGAIISVIFFFIFSAHIMRFVMISIPIMILSLVLAFGRRKGFTIPILVARSFAFIFAGKQYIWQKVETTAPTLPQTKKKEVQEEEIAPTIRIAEKSRLKRVANLIEIHPK